MNPPLYKFIHHRGRTYKILGHSYLGFIKNPEFKAEQRVFKELTDRDLRDMEVNNLKRRLLGQDPLKAEFVGHNFLIKRGCLDLVIFKFWTGEPEILTLINDEFKFDKKGNIHINDEVNIVYRDGFFCSTDPKMIEVVTDRTERLMKDLTINATGQQQKDFSRIRTDYAHIDRMKEKDIEAEEKKDKAKRYG